MTQMATLIWTVISLVGQGEPDLTPPANYGALTLLRTPTVKRELNLTESQVKQLAEIIARMNRQISGRVEAESKFLKSRVAASPPGTPIGINTSDITLNADNASVEVLTKIQSSRFRQILLQREGTFALGRPEVAKQIRLSKDQSDAVRKLVREARESDREACAVNFEVERRLRSAFDSTRQIPGQVLSGRLDAMEAERAFHATFVSRSAMFQKQRGSMREGATAKILDQLTREQRRSFDSLLGAPFDLEGATLPMGESDLKSSREEAAK